jgi:hypothetical protein
MPSDIDRFAQWWKSTLVGFCCEILINDSQDGRSHEEQQQP